MLIFNNIHAVVGRHAILKGVDLTLKAGAVHVLMGPNGSGKSTLAKLVAGYPGIEVTQGTLTFSGADLLALSPETRAHKGVFLAFQYPVSLPGVTVANFLKTAYNACRKANQQPPMNGLAFRKYLEEKMNLLGIPANFMSRMVNDGFSGGEKKKHEILQMAVLAPRLAILDETDSGLDVDALHTIGKGIQKLRHPTQTLLLITHYPRLLQYITPDYVHILHEGRIVKSGKKELADKVNVQGYDWLQS